MDEQTRKNLLDARRRADLQVLDLSDSLRRFLAPPRGLVPDGSELDCLRGVEDDLANALDRIARARTDMEILFGLEREQEPPR